MLLILLSFLAAVSAEPIQLSGGLTGNTNINIAHNITSWQSNGTIYIDDHRYVGPGAHLSAFEYDATDWILAYTLNGQSLFEQYRGTTHITTLANITGTHATGICGNMCYIFWQHESNMMGALLDKPDDAHVIMHAAGRYHTAIDDDTIFVCSRTKARIVDPVVWPPIGFDAFGLSCDLVDVGYIVVHKNTRTKIAHREVTISDVETTEISSDGPHAFWHGSIVSEPSYSELAISGDYWAYIEDDNVYVDHRKESETLAYLSYIIIGLVATIVPGFGYFLYRLVHNHAPDHEYVEMEQRLGKPMRTGDSSALYKRYVDGTIRVLTLYNNLTAEQVAAQGDMMRSMNHANIMPGYAEGGGIIMSYYPRGDVRSYMSSAPVDTLEVALQVCNGMQYLLSHITCHGDLKLSHCILDGTGIVKITGFGTGIRSERWMAPEIVGSPTTANEKSDVWSYGLLLWELCMGGQQLPLINALDARQGIRVPVDQSWPLAEIIDMCMHINPDCRPDFGVIHAKLIRLIA